ENPNKRAWITGFFERLLTETGVLEESFSLPLQTGDELPGDLFAEKGPMETSDDTITDVVGVMTNTYVFKNMSESERGELTRVIEGVLERDTTDRIRVWLAPVDEPTWKNYRICKIALGDEEQREKHRAWLIRLKEEGRFEWPSQDAAKSSDEINRAVET